MSAPTFESRESEYINYGFLSIKAGNAIKAILGGQSLSIEDKQALERAEKFLKDISSGVNLVTTGVYKHGSNPNETMAALDYAIDPIVLLQDIIKNQDISGFFDEMADAIHVSAFKSGEPNDNEDMLGNAQQFFDFLYTSLLASLNSGRPSIGRTPKLGLMKSFGV